MKKILKKFLLCILIISVFGLYASNQVFANEAFANAVGFLTTLIGGIASILLWPKKLIMLGIVTAVQVLTSAVASIGGPGSAGNVAMMVTPFDIFFNHLGITDVNFFNFNGDPDSLIIKFRQAIAMWYYIVRLLATTGLLLILLYVGIRMALSTVASEKAAYKSMLVNWVASMALLFVLHYMMVFVLSLNTTIINVLYNIAVDQDMSKFIGQLMISAALIGINSWAALVLYAIIVFQTMTFLIMYIKRMVTIGFLIIISPLITITYALDKMGDGKSQALDAWMKEFIFNILIQPFHCILYMIFASVAVGLVTSNSVGDFLFDLVNPAAIGNFVLAVLCLKFIKEGENIIKNIFGFKKASSLGSVAASTAVTAAMIGNAGKVASGAGKTMGKLKNTIGNSWVGKSGIGKAVGKVSSSVSKVTDKFAPTRIMKSSFRKNIASSAGAVTAIMTNAGGSSMVQSVMAGNMTYKGVDTYMKGTVSHLAAETNDQIEATDDGKETNNERTARIINNLETFTDDKENNKAINAMLSEIRKALEAGGMDKESGKNATELLNQGIQHDLIKDPTKNFSMAEDKMAERIDSVLEQQQDYQQMSTADKTALRSSIMVATAGLAKHHGDVNIAKNYAMHEAIGGDTAKLTDRLKDSRKDKGESEISYSQPTENKTSESNSDESRSSTPEVPDKDKEQLLNDVENKCKDLGAIEEDIGKIKKLLGEEDDGGKIEQVLAALNSLSGKTTSSGLTQQTVQQIMKKEIINQIDDTNVEEITEKITVLEKVTELMEGSSTYQPSGNPQLDANMLKSALDSAMEELTRVGGVSLDDSGQYNQYKQAVQNLETAYNAAKTSIPTETTDDE